MKTKFSFFARCFKSRGFLLSKATLLFLVLFLPNLAEAQVGCFTQGGPGCIGYDPILLQPNNNKYVIRVFFHALRPLNGNGGITEAQAAESLDILNAYFNPHNIFFDWDCILIDELNDTYFNSPQANVCDIFTLNNQPGGLNIYIGRDNTLGEGRASGIPGTSIVIYGNQLLPNPNGYFNAPVYFSRSAVLAHEVGHCFGLWHTFHGNIPQENSGVVCGTPFNDLSACPECANGSNGSECGDYVADTPADIEVNPANYSNVSCLWEQSGNDNCTGQNYNPDATNIMCYSPVTCYNHFSIGQGLRMRNMLEFHSNFLPQNLCEYDIEVTPVVPSGPCQGGTFSINYQICQDHYAGNPSQVDLQVSSDLQGVVVGGDFSNTGFIDNLILMQGCTTIVLNVTIPQSTPIATNFNITLDVIPLIPSKTCVNIGDDCIISNEFSVNNPNPNFSYQVINCEVEFFNEEDYGVQTWDFGDGTLPFVGQNPTHDYSSSWPNQTFQVTHSVSYGCVTQTHTETITVNCAPGFTCSCPSPGLNLGIEGQTTYLSDYNLPLNSNIQGCIAIIGNLVIDKVNFSFFQANVMMQPGSSIEIPSGSNVNAYGSHFHGCDQMWEGIRVRGGGTFSLVFQSIIEDANVGIQAIEPGASIVATRSFFRRNLIGMASDFPFNLSCYGNTFDCPTSLSQPLSGQCTEAGISVSNGNTINVGAFGQIPNIFRGLNNGIIAIGNNLAVVNSNFIDIKQQGSDSYPIMGYGIYSEGGFGSWPSANTLIQVGNGSYQPSFINCTTGIYGKYTSLSAKNNKMTGMTDGIVSEYGFQGIDIRNNYIDCTRTGIEMSHTESLVPRSIYKNVIGLYDKGTGILVDETENDYLILDFNGSITDNMVDIYVPSQVFAQGINVYSAVGMNVDDNVIQMHPGADNAQGLSFGSGFNVNVNDNIVWGEGPGAVLKNVGIAATGCNATTWNCNKVYNLNKGIAFSLPCNTPDGFKGNEMNNCRIGLHLDNQGSQLGTQTAMGNKWFGSFSDRAARHDGNPFDVANSRFFANASSSAEWPSTRFPASGWFIDDPTQAYACSDDFDGDTDTDVSDAAIAGNTSSNNSTSKYLSERYLYRKLSKNPNLIQPGSVFETFFNQNDNSVIGKFYDIEKDIATAMTINSSTLAALSSNYSQIGLATEQLFETDSLFALATGQDSIALLNSRNSLLYLIDNLTLASSGLVAAITSQRMANASSVITNNSAIATSTVFEENDKTVNGIYLAMVASGAATFTPTQIATLTTIADQCPAVGGNAVFRARSVMNSVATNKVYDDEAICTSRESVSHGSATLNEWPVAVYPNPASTTINLGWSSREGNGQIVIKDMMGRQVLSSTLDLASGNAKLDVAQLYPAVYLVQLVEKGKVVFSSKVVLIR